MFLALFEMFANDVLINCFTLNDFKNFSNERHMTFNLVAPSLIKLIIGYCIYNFSIRIPTFIKCDEYPVKITLYRKL